MRPYLAFAYRLGFIDVSGFELVEQPVEFVAIEDQTRTLVQGAEPRSPRRVESTAFDADVFHRLRVAQASLHGYSSQAPTAKLPAAEVSRSDDLVAR